ncbi:MAG: hypothetical protein ACRDGA_07700, partial [Bacteroidota bacterium]
MEIPREKQIGLAGSVGLHLLLLLLFFFMHVPEIVQKQEFIEVSWGATASPSMSAVVPAASSSPVKEATPAVKKPVTIRKAAQPVVPPERRSIDLSDDIVRVPKTDKIDAPVAGTKSAPVETRTIGERDTRTGQEIGERERITPGSSTGTGPGGTSPLSSTGVGADVDRGVSYSVQWLDGGTRRRISGDLPKYPEGVNVEAQIKILTVVMPDGMVR